MTPEPAPHAVGPVDEPGGLTPAWLTAALGSTYPGAEVTAVTRTPVGTGQMGTSYRLGLTWSDGDPGGERPATLVAKLPTAEVAVRPMVAGAYATEVAFYREVASTVAVRTPACPYAAISESGTEFTLLLQDLHPARQGDQLVGSSFDQAGHAVVNLAGLHGPRWCDESLGDLGWLHVMDAEAAGLLGQVTRSAVTAFVDRLGERIAPADRTLLVEVGEAVAAWSTGRPERFGLVHGDYRMDNLMFDPPVEPPCSDRPGRAEPVIEPDGAPAVTAVDWQTVARGLPARDLAYFLETSLDPADRRAHEVELVTRYHRALISHGVTGYPAATCFDDYRYGALQGPLIIVLGAAYGTQTERGDAMFLTMTARSCEAVRDLGTLELV